MIQDESSTPTSPPRRGPPEVFLAYSHEDEALRVMLAAHLRMLVRQKVIRGWSERKLAPGDARRELVDERLEVADIVLLLISDGLLGSLADYEVDLARALERHAAGQARLVPVILSPCPWQAAASAALAELQVLPRDGRPVDDADAWCSEDSALTDVSQGLRRLAGRLRTERGETLAKTQRPARTTLHLAHEPFTPDDHIGLVGDLARRLQLADEHVVIERVGSGESGGALAVVAVPRRAGARLLELAGSGALRELGVTSAERTSHERSTTTSSRTRRHARRPKPPTDAQHTELVERIDGGLRQAAEDSAAPEVHQLVDSLATALGAGLPDDLARWLGSAAGRALIATRAYELLVDQGLVEAVSPPVHVRTQLGPKVAHPVNSAALARARNRTREQDEGLAHAAMLMLLTDMRLREFAEAVDQPIDATSSLQGRAIRALRDCLLDEQGAGDPARA